MYTAGTHYAALMIASTLMLLHALHAELTRLRSFVLADGLAGVTDLVQGSPGVIDSRLLLSRPGVVRHDGHIRPTGRWKRRSG